MATDRAPQLAEFHGLSRRNCFFEDNGCAAWLYLTEPAADSSTSAPIAADAFVFNHAAPVDPAMVPGFRGQQPPICVGFASPEAVCAGPSECDWSLRWSVDGESVAVLRGGHPIAFIRRGDKLGYSKAVAKVGPYGSPWSQALFEQAFAKVAGAEEGES